MLGHSRHLRNNVAGGPLHTKHLRKLLQILRAGLTDAEDGVAEPRHAQRVELLVEELDAKLAGQQRDVLDDGEPDTPVLVLGQLHDGREKRL